MYQNFCCFACASEYNSEISFHWSEADIRMPSLDHRVAPDYRHCKTQWFIKGNIPAGEKGGGFQYGSDIPLKGKTQILLLHK